MSRILQVIPIIILIKLSAECQNSVGTLTLDEDRVYEGYNLIYPHNQPDVYLLNSCGDVMHTWEDDENFRPGNTAYILNNGNLVKTKRENVSINDPIWAGGGGAIVDLREWNNDLINSFELNNEIARLHHDIAVTPEGTILMIAWEVKTKEEAISAGRDTGLIPNDILWPDYILEWNPVSDEIIWEWHIWDHLIQDYDNTQNNFGIVEDHPELVNINYDEHDGHQDWLHSNSIDYNSFLDHILISVPYFNEFWIIDHSTTTEEAASHQGGQRGQGGDLLYRWGNPQTYDAGTIEDKKSFFQHDVKWVTSEANQFSENFGLISLYNNRVNLNFSTLNVVSTDFDMTNNQYLKDNGMFLPIEFEVNRIHPDTLARASSNGLSSLQILPNNNLLALSGRWGYAYELTPENEIVWEYRIPLKSGDPVEQGTELTISNNITFRMDRYSLDFPGFSNRDLTAGPRLELNPNSEVCDIISATNEIELQNEFLRIIGNPASNTLTIDIDNEKFIDLIDISGNVIKRFSVTKGMNVHDISWLSKGIYILRNEFGNSRKFVKL